MLVSSGWFVGLRISELGGSCFCLYVYMTWETERKREMTGLVWICHQLIYEFKNLSCSWLVSTCMVSAYETSWLEHRTHLKADSPLAPFQKGDGQIEHLLLPWATHKGEPTPATGSHTSATFLDWVLVLCVCSGLHWVSLPLARKASA